MRSYFGEGDHARPPPRLAGLRTPLRFGLSLLATRGSTPSRRRARPSAGAQPASGR
jgi:hypothetical protein